MDNTQIIYTSSMHPRTTGRWEEKEKHENIIDAWQSARCSVCGKFHITPYPYYFHDFAYCPNCGARMRETLDTDYQEAQYE